MDEWFILSSDLNRSHGVIVYSIIKYILIQHIYNFQDHQYSAER